MNKIAAYRETFRRHRRLLTLPIVLAILIAAWSALGSTKSYMSTASLWVDNPAGTESSLGNLNPSLLPPSQQEQQVVTELLATRDFTRGVAVRSGLMQYLAAHPAGGFGPSALLSSLSGPGSVDSRVADALNSSSVTSTVQGPQVLQLSYVGPDAIIAQRTLSAIVAGLKQASTQFAAQHSQSTLAYNRAQVRTASRAVATARDQLNAYLRKHPGVGPGDPNLTALRTAQSVASSQLTQANSNLNGTGGSGAGGGSAGGIPTHVYDPPSVPSGPTSGKKKQVLAIVGGLFAGLLISFLGIVALTPSKPIRWEDDELVGDPDDTAPGNGARLPINGGGVPTNGAAVPTNGAAVPANDTAVSANGAAVSANGTAVSANGTAVPANGTAVSANGVEAALETNGSSDPAPAKKLVTARRVVARSRPPGGDSPPS